MKRVSNFNNDNNTLYIVATPIGNLNEMSPRAIDVLKNVDIIAVEDTRVTGKLLKHFEIDTKMIIHHKHNENASTDGIIELLASGKDVALVSDAGYPLISDPGHTLVSKAIHNDFNVVPISGSSAVLNALVASGLATDAFSFVGFLPLKKSEIKAKLESISDRTDTLIFYEAPHRIEATLKALETYLGNRSIVIAREITKRYEEFIRGNISAIIENLSTIKGEVVIVVEGKKIVDEEFLPVDLVQMVNDQISGGMSRSEAIKFVAKDTKVKRNDLYQIYHNDFEN
ncbi:MAG: 16S rRNA (cytidine(1402)-2'-O)-methyltransferase [Erysipelothrix sp.]|nr:16S rRNA (cytidine(1402)-2'-O)-methyltransferase [Erysipelothrix sp.]